MKLLLEYQEDGKIGFIRLVTNGTIYPDEELKEVLCNPNILILVSNYEHVLSEKQRENYHGFINFLKENNCKYCISEGNWTNLGVPNERKALTEQQRVDSFEKCMVKDCVSIFENSLYHCPRAYVLDKMGVDMKASEVIRFENITSKEELKEKLDIFYSLNELSACEYCNMPEERVQIPSAEQL